MTKRYVLTIESDLVEKFDAPGFQNWLQSIVDTVVDNVEILEAAEIIPHE